MRIHLRAIVGFVPVLATSLTVQTARADTSIDFENLANGTIVTNQYAGVTFSCVPASCGGGNPDAIIEVNPVGGTSSGTHALTLGVGCPDFSPDYLRMLFTQNQAEVSFTLGNSGGTYNIRAYNASNALIINQNVVIGGGFVGVFRVVRLFRPTGDIRRVEVEDTIGDFEYIDDLFFTTCDGDDTPPIAEMNAPLFHSCACGVITITGRACEPDGNYGNDTLEYMRINPPGPWTTVGSFTSPQCVAGGTLYTWNTAPVGITEGFYFLRLTVTNACGLTSQAITVVYVDKSFTGLSVTSPLGGAVLGGQVCVVGSVTDQCLTGWSVDYQPAGGGAFVNIAAGASAVLNNTFAVWDTVAAAVPDGNYNIRIQGTDSCGNLQTIVRVVTVDNTPPSGASCGCSGPSADTDGDGDVDVDDLLNVINHWGMFF